RVLVTSSWDGTARVWEVATGKALATLEHPDWVFGCRIARDGRHVLTACRDGIARLWDWRNGQLACAALKHRDGVFTAVFTPDARALGTAPWDGAVRVWDRATGKPLGPSYRAGGGVWNAEVTPDGRFAVLAGQFSALVALRLDERKRAGPPEL